LCAAGPVYHVLVTKEFPGKTTSIEFNKSKEALKNDIMFPYNAFKDFQFEGRYFHPGYNQLSSFLAKIAKSFDSIS
jgi:hypothetical protein